MEQAHHPGQDPDVQDSQSTNPYPETGYTQVVEYPEYRNTGATYQAQDGQSTNPYLETGYVNTVDYPEYRNIGPIYQTSSSCSALNPFTQNHQPADDLSTQNQQQHEPL